MSHTQILVWVMAVPLITWIAFFAYAMNIDRTLRRMERDEKDSDDL